MCDVIYWLEDKMKIRVPDYYKDFKCIDTNCKDSCCAGWEVDLDEKVTAYYRGVKGPFGKRLKKAMRFTRGKRFRLVNKRCPFLNEKNLCDLYTELGEDKLCDTCTNYPRYMEEYGDLKEIGVAFSCEVASALILNHKDKVTFVMEENQDPITSYNDIDYEMYEGCYQARKKAIALAQDRNRTVKERYALVLSLGEEIQEAVYQEDYNKIKEIVEKYERKDEIDEIVNKMKKETLPYAKKQQIMLQYVEVYEPLEVINDSWVKLLSLMKSNLYAQKVTADQYENAVKEFEESYEDFQLDFEQLLVYYIYRYFLKVVYDENLHSKMALAVVSFLMLRDCDTAWWLSKDRCFDKEDQIEIFHRYSREIEHSDDNFYALEQEYMEQSIFSKDMLLKMLV